MGKIKRVGKLIVASLLSLAILCTNTGTWTPVAAKAAGSSKSAVAFLELGEKGNATLVETEINGQKRYGLIDAGSETAYGKYVAPYLKNHTELNKAGGRVLDFIIVSHMDVDHTGGVSKAIDEFCNGNTTLYIKDASTITLENSRTRYNTIMSKAKSLGMPIGKIKPKAALSTSISSVNAIRSLSKETFLTKLDIFTKRADGSYSNTGNAIQEGIAFGEFHITLYNGQNWNKTSLLKNLTKSWDENVNSVTTLLKYTGSSDGKVYRTYLGADLGENSVQQYSQVVAEMTAKAMGSAVSIYQVAHHGFYNSLNAATASQLNFKHAIVTTSYDEIAEKGINKSDSTDHTTQLSFATNTLKAFLDLTSLQQVYFTGGRNYGKPSVDNTKFRVINKLKDKVKYLNNNSDNQDTILDGHVVVNFGSTLTITQDHIAR